MVLENYLLFEIIDFQRKQVWISYVEFKLLFQVFSTFRTIFRRFLPSGFKSTSSIRIHIIGWNWRVTRQESSKALFIYSSHVSLGGPGCIGWAWWNTVIPTSAPQPGWIPHRSDQPLLKQDPDTSQWKTTTTNNTRKREWYRQVWSCARNFSQVTCHVHILRGSFQIQQESTLRSTLTCY